MSLALLLFVEIDDLITLLDSFPLWFSLLVAGSSESFDVGLGSWHLIFTAIDGEEEVFPIVIKMFQFGLGQFTKMWYNTFLDGGMVFDELSGETDEGCRCFFVSRLYGEK